MRGAMPYGRQFTTTTRIYGLKAGKTYDSAYNFILSVEDYDKNPPAVHGGIL